VLETVVKVINDRMTEIQFSSYQFRRLQPEAINLCFGTLSFFVWRPQLTIIRDLLLLRFSHREKFRMAGGKDERLNKIQSVWIESPADNLGAVLLAEPAEIVRINHFSLKAIRR
jgi:hypothetical protein